MESRLKSAFRNTLAIPTTPSEPLRWLRIFFLMAQPPLLYQEGNCQPYRPVLLIVLPSSFAPSERTRIETIAEFRVRPLKSLSRSPPSTMRRSESFGVDGNIQVAKARPEFFR
jgi:hypothetical protein